MVIVGGASGGSPFFFFGSGLSRLGPGVMASKGGGPYISEGVAREPCVGEKRRQGCRCDRGGMTRFFWVFRA